MKLSHPQIRLVLAPATETLSNLVENGEENTFDFAFIDADKVRRWKCLREIDHCNYKFREDMTITMSCVSS